MEAEETVRSGIRAASSENYGLRSEGGSKLGNRESSADCQKDNEQCSSHQDRFSRLVLWLHRPSDPASIGLFRLLFGLLMIHDIMNERHMQHLPRVWGEPVHCHFPLFDFITPLPLAWMCVLYLVMLIGAICIACGVVFGFTVWLYVIPYWYVFLLDKTRWNNHSYLYGLFAFLLAFTHASNKYGVDALLFTEKRNAHVPFWNYAILRFQIVLVYFYAGLKKIDLDWLMGWSMRNLSKHWVFAPFSLVMSRETIDVVVVHFGGFTLDLLGGWLLLFPKTRTAAILFLSKFHLMNAAMFEIGMFPFVMLVTSAIFCGPDWPVRVSSALKRLFAKFASSPKLAADDTAPNAEGSAVSRGSTPDLLGSDNEPSSACLYSPTHLKESSRRGKFAHRDVLRSAPARGHKLVVGALSLYVFVQCFLPWSHFITKGYNLWTEGLYGYSWDMMVQSWAMQHIRIQFVSESTGETGFLNPDAMTVGMGRRWSSHPDMIKQYGRCVERKLNELGVDNVTLSIDVWRSMNGRFQQRMIDPRVDILRAEWSPFSAPNWTMPLLSSLTDWRQKLMEIRAEFRRASAEAKERAPWIVFAADFPGLSLENFVQRDVDRAYLELLDGEIEVEFLGRRGDGSEVDETHNVSEGEIDPALVPSTSATDHSEEACQDADDQFCAGGGRETRNETADAASEFESEIGSVVESAPRHAKRDNVSLVEAGRRIQLPSGEYHRVHTLGTRPSCYMYVFINSTDVEAWRNSTRLRELLGLLENVTLAATSPTGDKWNFSEIRDVAAFTNKSIDDPDVSNLHAKFLRRHADRAAASRPLLSRFVNLLSTKFVDQLYNYGKALENAGKAVISIARGITMEELLSEERLMKESARIARSYADGST